MSEPGWFVSTQRLRFNDNDMVGHVNNAVYATLFEAGRTELMDAAGLFERGGGLAGVIVRLEIDFKREMSWPGEVVIESAVSKFGGKSIHIRQRTRVGGELTSEGVAVLVLIDRATRRSVELDPAVRERFAPWTLPGA